VKGRTCAVSAILFQCGGRRGNMGPDQETDIHRGCRIVGSGVGDELPGSWFIIVLRLPFLILLLLLHIYFIAFSRASVFADH
jgi:hypothetical protein